jgi:large subunit ribosomal protein L5
MQVPRLEKIVVNIGLGEALDNPKALEAAVNDLPLSPGRSRSDQGAQEHCELQTARRTHDRHQGHPARPRMWAFLDRLMNIALPRVRDFRGVSPNAFDGRGNYTLGLKDQLVFPEIEYDKIDKLRGMEVTIVTTAQNDNQARAMLQLLGMPFSGKKEA